MRWQTTSLTNGSPLKYATPCTPFCANAWWRKVLSDPNVSDLDKRNLLGTIVQKFICSKEGAEVVFLPGIFGDAGKQAGANDIFYTTCIGIKTQR
jgi:hypothetical protein